MKFFLNHITVSVALLLIVAGGFAVDDHATISSLHELLAPYIETPWYYKNDSIITSGESWFGIYQNTISEPIISYATLYETLTALDSQLFEEVETGAYWFGEKDNSVYVQRIIAPSKSTLAIFSDLHGSVHSLLRSLKALVAEGYLNDDFTVKNPNFYLIFLGDYVDRGAFTPEVLYVLMKLKLVNPSHVFLLIGNHEEGGTTPTSWKDDLQRRYPEQANELINRFEKFFYLFPSALYFGTRNSKGGLDYVVLSHAGVNINYDVYDFLAEKDATRCYFYGGDLPNAPARSQYTWTYIISTPEEVSSSTNHIIRIGQINAWLSYINREEVCVHDIIRGHQHGSRSYDPPLEAGQGYARQENVHTIFSGAGAGGVYLPYDSFLLLHTAGDFSAWQGSHFFRQVGPSDDDITAFGMRLLPLLQAYRGKGARLGDLVRLKPDEKKSLLERLAHDGLVPPMYDNSLNIVAIPWNSSPIQLSRCVVA